MREISSDLLDLTQELKQELKLPSPTKVYPTGKGKSKNDILIQRLAAEFGHDPVEELIKLARSSKTSSDIKMKINMELLNYCIPKLKAIDTNPNQGETISVNVILPSKSTM